jgi:uroporphyrinogen-III decarboxylase
MDVNPPSKLKWISHADLAIKRRPTVRREEFLDAMTFVRNDRPLFTEIFGPLVGLKEEWEAQGASPEELDFSAFRYRDESRFEIPVFTGLFAGPPEVLLEENETHRIFRDALGRTMKMMKGVATLPLPMDYPVQNMQDWLRVKPLYAFTPERLAGDWLDAAQKARQRGQVICVSIPGGFDEPRQLMGEERLCLAYYEQPALVQDMLDTFQDTALRVLEAVTAQVPVDLLAVHEDMAGKPGPLIGPRLVKQFIAPYYRAVWDLLQEHGARLFEQDSDGNMEAVIPAFLEAGVNLMYPIEPAAGMDIVRLRLAYGKRLAFRGGIDKHVLRRSQAEILAELEYKLPPIMRTGGCVLGLDHRVPNGTPLANYRFYINKVWEIFDRLST